MKKTDEMPFQQNDKTCPICGKNFIPAPFHSYSCIGLCGNHVLVCTYGCMLKAERNPKIIYENHKGAEK